LEIREEDCGRCLEEFEGWGCTEHWSADGLLFHIATSSDQIIHAVWSTDPVLSNYNKEYGNRASRYVAQCYVRNILVPVTPELIAQNVSDLASALQEVEGL
jgi:hypothetical protein